MFHLNKSTIAVFLLSSITASLATITFNEASAKNLRVGAAGCMPVYNGYFNDDTSEIFDGGDFSADDDSGHSELVCAIQEFSDWNRQVATSVEVVVYDNTASDGVIVSACRSNYASTTDTCGNNVGSGSNSNTPGWDTYFPPITGVTGVWDDTTLGTAYLFVWVPEDGYFDGYIIKDVNG